MATGSTPAISPWASGCSEHFHAPSQRLRSLRQHEDLRGAGEQEAAGPAVTVDGAFDDGKQTGRLLHLVDHQQAFLALDEAARIGQRRGEDHRLVQRQVAPAARRRHGLRKHALAGLARAGEQDDGRVGERVGKPRVQPTPR